MKKQMRNAIVMLLGFAMMLTVLTGCGSTAAPAEAPAEAAAEDTAAADSEAKEACTINCFIAASLANTMNAQAEAFNADNADVEILFNADSSGTLQTQIEEGAECDLFFSAAVKQMNTLEEEDLIVEGSRVDLLENKVVLIKAKDAQTSVTGFENITDAANLALAGEDVPVGQYAREIFTNLGIDVSGIEINEGANVTAVLTAVAEGSNEVGVVYATDAASMPDDVEIIAEAPEGSMETAVYPAALVVNEGQSEAQAAAVEAFLEFLKGDKAAEIFKTFGFSIH